MGDTFRRCTWGKSLLNDTNSDVADPLRIGCSGVRWGGAGAGALAGWGGMCV